MRNDLIKFNPKNCMKEAYACLRVFASLLCKIRFGFRESSTSWRGGAKGEALTEKADFHVR